MTRLLLAALALALLAGCGKKGSPVPPGPAAAIIYPKSYPAPELPEVATRVAAHTVVLSPGVPAVTGCRG